MKKELLIIGTPCVRSLGPRGMSGMDSGTMGCFLSIKLIEVFFLPTLLCGLDMNNMNEVKMLYNVHTSVTLLTVL